MFSASYAAVAEKCLHDPWCYLLETNSGQQFLFSLAVVDKATGWVHLQAFDAEASFPAALLKANACKVPERGISVRIRDVAWIADGDS